MSTSVKLTPAAAKKTADVVRKALKTPIDLRGAATPQLSVVWVYITSNTGTALYQGKLQRGAATDTSDTGVTNDGKTVIVKNRCEVGSTAASPYLDNGSIVWGHIRGIDSATSLPIVWTDAVTCAVCTADAGGSSSSSSGG